MLVIISGPSGVGKSYCIDFFCRHHDFLSMTPFTTRDPRPSEAEGVHYHFLKEEELKEKSQGFQLGYWTKPFGKATYGYSHHVDDLSARPENWIIQSTTDVALAIKEKNPECVLVFLDYESKEQMEHRIRLRYGDSEEALSRRLSHAESEIAAKDKYDYLVKSSNPDKIILKIADYIFKNVVATPSVERVPGPLSDVDLRNSLEGNNGIKITGFEKDVSEYIDGWSVDFTLGHKYYRTPRRWFIWQQFNLAYANEEEVHRRFKEYVCNKGKGITLRPNEFILTSTKQVVKLPNNIVGFISGRSSFSRIGVSVELSQTILQPGHHDIIPLQIKNNLPYPVTIFPDMKIVQAVFFRTISNSTSSYEDRKDAKYRYLETLRSKFHLDPEIDIIKSSIPSKIRVNWTPIINLLLICTGVFSLIILLLKGVAKDEYVDALAHFTVGTIGLGIVLIAVRAAMAFAKK